MMKIRQPSHARFPLAGSIVGAFILLAIGVSALLVSSTTLDAQERGERRSRPGRGSFQRARGNQNSARGRLSAVARRKAENAKLGVMAPEFELPLLDENAEKAKGKHEKIRLSSFRGKKPVVLIFGSYT